MISIIICSVDDARFAAVAKNFTDLLKDELHEIIRISDARSLCEGYTRGIARSRGDLLIFSHDDIEILSPDFAVRLKEQLGRFDLVGIAGTSRLIRGEWIVAGPPYIFGQVAQVHPDGGFLVLIFGVPARAVGGIQALDGVFLAARRSVVEKIPFDAQTFDGFHLYDLDFTFAAHLAGFRLGVANDIHILHRSMGFKDESWQRYSKRFDEKYAGQLDPMAPRHCGYAWVHLHTRDEIMELMNTTLLSADLSP
jgi:hypothetical protein